MEELKSYLHKKISTNKPICIIDIETTEVNTEIARIVEITVIKVNTDGSTEIKTKRINPEIPIPPEATKIHGITDEDVKDKPLFKQIAKGLLTFISNCDLGGYSSNRFDIPVLNTEFLRAGLVFEYKDVNFYDICNIFMRKEGRTLKDAYRFYVGGDLKDAHSSEVDAIATLKIFEAQLDKYDDLPTEPIELDLYGYYDKKRVDIGGKLTYNQEGEIITNFGGDKTKGKILKNDLGLCQWIIDKDFSEDVKFIVKNIIEENKKF